MRNHELEMLAYVKLADLSQQKRQLPGRDKFLLLAGMAAMRAGWPEVARRCRELVLKHNQFHLIGKFETFADALRHPDFQPFAKRLERFCPYEKAEHLLRQLQIDPNVSAAGLGETGGEIALALLAGDEGTPEKTTDD